MKVAMISGSWPPERCGVGDYSERLGVSLENAGAEVHNLGGSTGDWWSKSGIVRSIRKESYDIVHIQYPTIGYGKSIAPSVIPLMNIGRASVVTLHEFSSFTRKRRPWFVPFAQCVKARIFTNPHERDFFRSAMHPLSGLDVVIPIGSSIGKGRSKKKKNSICYFGLIAPDKGIEEFVSLAKIASVDRVLEFSLIGATTKLHEGYAERILDDAGKTGVLIKKNLSEADVADALSSQEFSYLPYPDGATAKRSSLLAVQLNEAIVITTHTEITPKNIVESTFSADSPAEAYGLILSLINGSITPGKMNVEPRSSLPTWDSIASCHIDLYSSIINKG